MSFHVIVMINGFEGREGIARWVRLRVKAPMFDALGTKWSWRLAYYS